MSFKINQNNRGNINWMILLLLFGLFYVSNAWTPSSYGWPIKYFGVTDRGIVAGTPRGGRSDEWGISTPLTQATVNNKFQRFNNTSIYKEDLRSVFSMPIRDWGLFFKPSMWSYVFLSPAHAFSLYHFSFIFLFIAGYAFLFQFLGGRTTESFLLSTGLFFTGYMQFWWTTFGQLSAFFPWLVLLVLWEKPHMLVRALILYWLTVACMLSAHFYPPLFIQFAFIAVIMVIAFRSELLKPGFIFVYGLTALAAIATTFWYLRDPLSEMLPTIYPGQRVSSGGGESLQMILSQFFPLINLHDLKPLFKINMPESGVISSLLFLIVLFFLDYKETFKKTIVPSKALIVLAIALTACYAWMCIDLPSWIGKPLLWNRIDPHRMYFASGILTLAITLILFFRGSFQVNLYRWALLVVSFAAVTFYYKVVLAELQLNTIYWEILILSATGLPRFIPETHRPNAFRITSLLVATGYGVWAFHGYNPIQSASVIFDREKTLVTQALDTLVINTEQPVLEVPGFPGATLNGWGYPSVSHVLLTPKLAVWEKIFPELTAEERNQLFNRYAIVEVSYKATRPTLVSADSVRIPVDSVTDNLLNARRLEWGLVAPRYSLERGSIDFVNCKDSTLIISGWAWWRGKDSSQALSLVSEALPLRSEFRIIPRYDVATHFNDAALVWGGFEVRAELGQKCSRTHPPLCAVSTDMRGHRYRLDNSDSRICPETSTTQ